MEYSCLRFFTRYTYRIGSDAIEVSKKGLLDNVEYEVPFANMIPRKSVGSYAQNNALFVAVLSLVLAVIAASVDSIELFLICAFIGLVSFMTFLVSRVRMVTITTYALDSIIIYYKKSQRQAAIDFADEVIKAARSYLKSKYNVFDRMMPLQKQYDNLEYLREQDLITMNEYQEIKNYLLGGGERRNIGFHQ